MAYHYDLTYLALRNEHGQVQGILVFAVDVTEQVRTRRPTGPAAGQRPGPGAARPVSGV